MMAALLMAQTCQRNRQKLSFKVFADRQEQAFQSTCQESGSGTLVSQQPAWMFPSIILVLTEMNSVLKLSSLRKLLQGASASIPIKIFGLDQMFFRDNSPLIHVVNQQDQQ